MQDTATGMLQGLWLGQVQRDWNKQGPPTHCCSGQRWQVTTSKIVLQWPIFWCCN